MTTLPWEAYSSTTVEVASERCTRRSWQRSRKNVEDDVVCEKVEEVVSVGETLQALFDDAEERVQGTKVVNVTYQ